MNIAILGAGAMGSLYGGYLAEAGNRVWLIDTWEEHVDTINKYGLLLIEGKQEKRISLKAVTHATQINDILDLIIIFVKSYNTRTALEESYSLFSNETTVLTLQNGLGNDKIISEFFPEKNIIIGTTFHGANILGPGKVLHAGWGKTIIGDLSEEANRKLEKVARILNDAGLETELNNSIDEIIWSKIIVNVGINALTAILEIKNGELLKHTETKILLNNLVEEGIQVARASGVTLPEDDFIKHVMDVTYLTSQNRSSMLQDISSRRKTEIDFINGAIVNKGRELGIDVPYNQALTLLIKSKERINENK